MRIAAPIFATALTLALVPALASCGQTDAPVASAQAKEIAWREGDVDDALAEAKESGKPVILYWGAVWCPPCNQMKATLFKDPDFIAETQKFVPVYLDGDTKDAQRWGERFGISGYPTVIVLRPDGTEITRISSATMANELPDLLQVAAGRTTSIEALLEKAQTDTASLDADDWRILAGFDWRNDPRHFADDAKTGKLLDQLAAAAPEPALQRRFGLLALAVQAEEGDDGKVALDAAQQARVGEKLTPILSSPGEIMANGQELTHDAPALVTALPKSPKREELTGKLIAAGDAIYANEKLSLTERVEALNIDVALATANGPIPASLLAKVRERAAWADKTATDKISRQSVIDSAAYLLFDAGDRAGAKKLLTAELERSNQPYYYMSSLSDFAEKEGDKAAAVEWARKAYEAAQGPATRVQWAILYSNAVLRLTPEDEAAVAKSGEAVIAELSKSPDSYYQRTRVKLAAWGDKLREWSEAHDGADILSQLRTKMATACAGQGSQAAACNSWSKAA
ncbi:thioredoxin family protein [Croceibacterium sp. LX-88]|uniref:Thioredoxin family protein n=1 Tax=Croceibacterium selenioxidans TaxID=2838833 RepID=A0ABS5W702_9SPHN|nr:thioredoxin family protein [Croceibacterium selenioxidans]MBT2135520.1 thioredoxin family protein [Croceibacterium selenioxidans]